MPLNDLDLTTLRLFAAVCDSRSILRVSEHEGIVPSAITKRIAKLERELGLQLLKRGNGGVVPTGAGLTVLEHAQKLIENSRGLNDALHRYREGRSGLVSIVAPYSNSASHLPLDIAAFLSLPDHTGTRLKFVQSSSLDIPRLVREGRIDVGVLWDTVETTGLSTLDYSPDLTSAIVRPDHALAKRESVRLEEALSYDYIGLPWFGSTEALLRRSGAIRHPVPPPRVEAPTIEIALHLARAGVGLSILPAEPSSLAAAHELAQLSAVPLDEPWARRRHLICYRDGVDLAPAARALVEHLARAAADRATRCA